MVQVNSGKMEGEGNHGKLVAIAENFYDIEGKEGGLQKNFHKEQRLLENYARVCYNMVAKNVKSGMKNEIVDGHAYAFDLFV